MAEPRVVELGEEFTKFVFSSFTAYNNILVYLKVNLGSFKAHFMSFKVHLSQYRQFKANFR